MASLWAKTQTTLETIKWEHSIVSSVVWLYGRTDGQMAFLNFPIGNE